MSHVQRPMSLFLAAALAAALLPRAAFALADQEAFGICEHVSMRIDTFGGEFERRDTVFAGLRAAGIRWVRTDFRWMGCTWPWETEGEYNWYDFDCVFESAEMHGVAVLPILSGGNPWTGTAAYDDLDGWCDFVRRFVERYRGRFSAVEIWNEPNLSAFWGGSTAQYVALLQRSCAAVKAVDPSVRIVLGGIAGNPADYVDSLYAAGAQGAFDVMNLHPYNGQRAPAAQWETSSGFLGLTKTKQSIPLWIDRVRSKMDAAGDSSKPIWITEIGWHADGASSSVSEVTQAQYVADAVPLLLGKGVEKIFLYEYRAPEEALDSGPEESYFGIVHSGFSPKPAYFAYRNAIYEAVHGTADPDADSVFLVYADGWGVQSAAAAGGWSDGAAPHSDADYVVALGSSPGLWTPNAPGETVFAGRSLTLGQAGGGAAGMLRLLGWGSAFTVADLRLNGGTCCLTGSTGDDGETLSGAVSVRTAAAAPFVFRADPDGTRGFTLAASLSGAVGTAIAAEASETATLDISFTGDASAYAGQFAADGAAVTARFSAAALAGPSGAGGIALRSGAALAPIADGQVFATARTLSSADGTARIDVPAGQTIVLAAPISGTFRKTGAGTLVIDGATTGTGSIVAGEGDVRVDVDTAHFVSAIDGGRVVYCVPEGSLGSAQSIAAVSVPAPSAAGGVVLSDGATALGWDASVRWEEDSAGSGAFTAYIDVAAAPRTVVGADSFEAYAAGTAAAALPGWTGGGAVAAATPATRAGWPIPGETHERVLVPGDIATRTWADSFARDSQSLDFLVQVRVAADGTDWESAVPHDDAAQLRLAFGADGAPCLWHAGEDGTGVWTKLAVFRAFASGDWARVSIDFDYSASGAAFAQVRIDGDPCRAAAGRRAPADAAPNGGTWFRLPASAAASRKVSSLELSDAQGVDDLVLAFHDPSLAPDFAPFPPIVRPLVFMLK